MNLFKKFKQLDEKKKNEVVITLIITVALMIALPVYAWFASNKNLETITKIKEPGEIIIRAGKRNGQTEADSIVNFEMKDIDIESIAGGKPQRFVFSVMPGDYNLGYRIQLAHTTNIPFVYTLYKAEAPDTTGMTEEQLAELEQLGELTVYSPVNDKNDKTYYQTVGPAITMTARNEDDASAVGRKIAKQNDTGDSFKCYSQTYTASDAPEVYAVPVYLQSAKQTHSGDSADSYDYYILQLSWDTTAERGDDYAFKDWNVGKNNKETDIIYITASRTE